MFKREVSRLVQTLEFELDVSRLVRTIAFVCDVSGLGRTLVFVPASPPSLSLSPSLRSSGPSRSSLPQLTPPCRF